MDPEERRLMLKAHSIGPKMVSWLEASGIMKLEDVRNRDAQELALQIHVETGVKMNALGLRALENLVAFANERAQ